MALAAGAAGEADEIRSRSSRGSGNSIRVLQIRAKQRRAEALALQAGAELAEAEEDESAAGISVKSLPAPDAQWETSTRRSAVTLPPPRGPFLGTLDGADGTLNLTPEGKWESSSIRTPTPTVGHWQNLILELSTEQTEL